MELPNNSFGTHPESGKGSGTLVEVSKEVGIRVWAISDRVPFTMSSSIGGSVGFPLRGGSQLPREGSAVNLRLLVRQWEQFVYD